MVPTATVSEDEPSPIAKVETNCYQVVVTLSSSHDFIQRHFTCKSIDSRNDFQVLHLTSESSGNISSQFQSF